MNPTIRSDCRRLILESARRNDQRDWSGLASLYTADGRLTRPSGEVVVGRAAIERSYRSGSPDRRTRHVCTNILVEVDDGATATGLTTVLLFAWTETDGDGLPATSPVLGEFEDRFVLVDGRWLLSERTARLLARVAGG